MTRERSLKARQRYAAWLMAKHNVVGVCTAKKKVGGRTTDRWCVCVLVRNKLPMASVEPEDRIPQTVGGALTDVIQVGSITAYQFRTDWWPVAPPGVSVGHFDITAGTLGFFAEHDVGTMIVSNNHVLGDSNRGTRGDGIHQPGPADQPPDLQNRIGQLWEFVWIKFKGQPPPPDKCSFANAITRLLNVGSKVIRSKTHFAAFDDVPINRVDAAIATVDRTDKIDRRILDKDNKPTITVPGFTTLTVGDRVAKSGRTTGETDSGFVMATDGIVDVDYGQGLVATFDGQVFIEPPENDLRPFSAPGDSGSAIRKFETNEIGALLFAGSDRLTVGNPIADVVSALKIRL